MFPETHNRAPYPGELKAAQWPAIQDKERVIVNVAQLFVRNLASMQQLRDAVEDLKIVKKLKLR